MRMSTDDISALHAALQDAYQVVDFLVRGESGDQHEALWEDLRAALRITASALGLIGECPFCGAWFSTHAEMCYPEHEGGEV